MNAIGTSKRPLNMKYTWIVFFLITVLQSFCFVEVCDSLQIISSQITELTSKLNKRFQENNPKNANILFSPINIYAALALVHSGTNGSTRDEMSDVMGIPKTWESKKVRSVIRSLLNSAKVSRETRMSENGNVKNLNATSLNFANGIFVHNKLQLKKKYITNAKSSYDSEVINVDFVNNGSEATDIINKYVANKTENHIPQLYPEPLSSDTRILVASSLYFKAVWENKFQREVTRPELFYSENGNITVDMMHNKYDMPYADIPSLGVEVVKLWFAEKYISMLIVKPYENQTLSNLLKNLTSDDINKIIEETNITTQRDYTNVDIKLPRTTFKWSKKLNEELIQLGIKKLFTEQADLTNMVEKANLKVTEVAHATDIKITEDGTEASAVTTMQVALRSAFFKKKAVFIVNKPFLVLIYHDKIRSILFFGSVQNPNA